MENQNYFPDTLRTEFNSICSDRFIVLLEIFSFAKRTFEEEMFM